MSLLLRSSFDDLLRSSAWPDGRDLPVTRHDTHVSVVLLRGEVALKLKKAVRFPFLDFSTAEARRRACEAEVVLNRRLAGQVYVGVDDVRLGTDGRWTLVGNGPVVDAAVHMKRLPDEATFASLLERDALGSRELRRLAERIARFHAAARAGPDLDRYATPEHVSALAEENFADIGARAAELVGPDSANAAREQLRSSIRARTGALARRIAEARIRDGHGDLRADHVYLLGEDVVVLDCVEFSEAYRCGDVAGDVAFLAMDLAVRGRPDLAERWLALYARASGDVDLYTVVDLYASYRAWVRAKIELASGHPDRARRYLLLARAEVAEPLRPPRILVVLGQIASGKSALAARIGALMGIPVVSSDVVRKRLAGVATTTRLGKVPFAGAYDAGTTDRVYAELLRLAEVVVRSGRSVVLDATFRSAELRRGPTELARRLGVAVVFVETWAPPEILRERLRAREGAATTSDAREDLLEPFVAAWEPPTEVAVRRIETVPRQSASRRWT